MKKILKRHLYLLFAVLCATLAGCTNDPSSTGSGEYAEGNPLEVTVFFEPISKLAELPSPDSMSLEVHGLSNVGLYIYYADDYENDDLSSPYIRNMECRIEDGKLYPVLGSGENDSNEKIFIYDQMTLVAFYPYNEAMSEEENFFQTKADEANYPITRDDYSQQYYIPYRAQTTTDPTRSFYTELYFVPKHTYKVEIVVVSDDTAILPEGDNIMILPAIDPVDNDDLSADGKRAAWYDHVFAENNRTGGSHVRRYTAYIWTRNENESKNDIPKGEILLQSDQLTLIASQDVTVAEDQVYRYGYNMTTGEIFIPTSSFLVHDMESLQAVNGMDATAYQVCDIDLTGQQWTPISFYGGRYDGGEHRILNMTVDGSGTEAGLFGHVKGNSWICNVNLVDPVITVNNPSDTVYVGAICGKVNTPYTDAELSELLDNLPPNLSEVVKQELLKKLLEEALSNTSDIVACRVENPTITVTAKAAFVGTIAGLAGEKEDTDEYKSKIWDTYSLGGSISVNEGSEGNNSFGYVGGFCGLNNGLITRSYTTIEEIAFTAPQITGPDTVMVNRAQGFANLGTVIADAQISDSFSMLDDTNTGVSLIATNWPNFPLYTDKWPVLTTGWLSSPSTSFWYSLGSSPDTYPILQYERR